MAAWILPAAIAAGSAWLGKKGGDTQNREQRIEAQKTRQHQTSEAGRSMSHASAEADKAMRFSERMRNTQWQAGIADMEKAGINPALAYSRGGASAPMGSAGSGAAGGGAQANVEDAIGKGTSSAKAGMMLKKQFALLDAQIMDTRASATQKGAGTALLGFQQGMAEKDIKLKQQMLEMVGFDMVRASNMARAQSGAAGQKAALISMMRSSIFGGGGAVSPIRIGGR